MKEARDAQFTEPGASERPSGLYVHIPFCERKCVYCDFYSVEGLQNVDFFINCLKKEISLAASLGSHGAQFDTIFLGGGTPSLLSPRQLGSIIDGLTKTFSVLPDAEITIEANPGTVGRKKLVGYRSLGVNRISIGVQSFHDEELRFLGRIHDANLGTLCVRDAQVAGFENISLDLIHSIPVPGELPTRTPSSGGGDSRVRWRWESNLRQAVAFHLHRVDQHLDHPPIA